MINKTRTSYLVVIEAHEIIISFCELAARMPNVGLQGDYSWVDAEDQKAQNVGKLHLVLALEITQSNYFYGCVSNEDVIVQFSQFCHLLMCD